MFLSHLTVSNPIPFQHTRIGFFKVALLLVQRKKGKESDNYIERDLETKTFISVDENTNCFQARVRHPINNDLASIPEAAK